MSRPSAVVAAIGVLLLGPAGCGGSDLVPIHGTTTRVAPAASEQGGKNLLRMHIFTTEDECAAAVKEEDVPLCLPYVDRASGQVRVGFQMKVDTDEYPVPLTEENIEIYHKGTRVLREGLKDYQIVPHDPTRASQLFILLIDSSGSMAYTDEGSQRTRMEKLRAALLKTDVVDAFFPSDVDTAVAPFVFKGSGAPEPLGGQWIVTKKKDYRQLIQNELQVGSGYTYLYNAVDWSTTTLMEKQEIKDAIQIKHMAPTIIALTDGFNNETPADLCKDNAPRLEKLLGRLDTLRKEGSDIRYTPTVYTVGLGKSAWRNVDPLDGTRVSASKMCRNYGDMRIDGGVETRGVDNQALKWIAQVGGGSSFISRTTDGLAEAFKAAAATRYRWFEARYRVDPFHLRRAFDTKLKLTSFLGASATIRLHPSGWFDAPPGIRGPDGWVLAAPPYRRSLTLAMPILGFLAAIGYLPAAMFNVRRALFSRVARKRKKPASKAA